MFITASNHGAQFLLHEHSCFDNTLPKSWTSVVQWVTVDEPRIPSDHQRVRLRPREIEPTYQAQLGRRQVSYLIKTAQPTRVLAELLDELVAEGVGLGERSENHILSPSKQYSI